MVANLTIGATVLSGMDHGGPSGPIIARGNRFMQALSSAPSRTPAGSAHLFNDMFDGMCAQMREFGTQVQRAARSDATVVIIGESGTGNEGVARAIHGGSERADHPLVAVQRVPS